MGIACEFFGKKIKKLLFYFVYLSLKSNLFCKILLIVLYEMFFFYFLFNVCYMDCLLGWFYQKFKLFHRSCFIKIK